MLLEQFSFECRKVIDFALTTLPIGLVFTSNATTRLARAIGMTQVKTKFKANSNTSKIIRAFHHFGKLFRREAIWIQCFHWPNLSTFMPEWYFVFTFCSARGCMQGWCTGESACLLPLWPGSDSRTRRYMWVEFVVGSRPWRPFLENGPGNLTGPKSYFDIKVSRRVGVF